MASSSMMFFYHTQRRGTVSRTFLDELSARRMDLYLTTHTTDKHPGPGGIRIYDRSRRAPVDPRLKPRGHWDRQTLGNKFDNYAVLWSEGVTSRELSLTGT
jgi:hypothetical protein